MPVKNSIFIGFSWSQGFMIPVELISITSSLRIDWKKDRDGPVLIRSTTGAGVTRDAGDPTQFAVSFDAGQTADLTSGRLTGEFVEERNDGSERIIGAQVIVPVVKPFAEPTP